MSNKELYLQKRRAQLDQWKAELAVLKAKASGTSADVQLKMNKQIEVVEGNIEEGRARLSELARATDDAWDSIKEGVESAWGSLKSSVSDAAAKFKQ